MRGGGRGGTSNIHCVADLDLLRDAEEFFWGVLDSPS